MIVINEKRNCGKTAKLVALLEKDLANILLVYSLGEAHRIIEEYSRRVNVDLIRRVVTWDYYLATPELWGRPLLIDNVDIFLRHTFRTESIRGVSINAV